MTRQAGDPVPGHRLLRLARFVFDDDAIDRIFEPALADLQRALRQAGTNPARRVWVRVREHAAFWKLVAVALVLPGTGAGAPLGALLLGRHSAGSLLLLVPILYLGLSWLFTGFVAGSIAGGILMSFAIASWNQRHPTVVARARRDATSRDPEINISSVPVGGDIGGFFFVAASSAVALLGVPGLRVFVIAAVAVGLLVAWARVAWMRGHDGPPVNHVVGR
jgi:hypothetical protein